MHNKSELMFLSARQESCARNLSAPWDRACVIRVLISP